MNFHFGVMFQDLFSILCRSLVWICSRQPDLGFSWKVKFECMLVEYCAITRLCCSHISAKVLLIAHLNYLCS